MIIKAIFYVDYGKGYSVKEVIDTIKRVTKKDFKVELQGRRAGDLACLISNNSKIISKMRWVPKYDDLELIYDSAYKW